jgi:hypothetical protein
MNLFVLFGDGAITRKKNDGNLHHALRAMMQFPVIFFPGDTPSPNKKINSFLKTITEALLKTSHYRSFVKDIIRSALSALHYKSFVTEITLQGLRYKRYIIVSRLQTLHYQRCVTDLTL